MKPIIRVENLGKQYRLGRSQAAPYATLRESLTEAVRAPLRRLRRGGKGSAGSRAGETFWALKDVSFEVYPGEVVGVIGRNGAGKSTLLKILSRVTEPTTGLVDLYGRVGSLLEVGTGFHPELTGRENIFLNGAILGMGRREIARKFDEIVAFAEIERFIDTPVKRYSSGMYIRLAFAVAAHIATEILVVDEVLAVGDSEFQKKCLGKMESISGQNGRTVLFVSHNMNTIGRLCHRCVLLKDGLVVESGRSSEILALYNKAAFTYEASFTGGSIKQVTARQEGEDILITAIYEHQHPLTAVCFGFVLYDRTGQPVCGSNPLLDRLDRFGRSTSSGHILVRMRQPKLRDGIYSLSIWLGEGGPNFFAAENCLLIKIDGMTKSHHIEAAIAGSISPVCEWIINAR